MDYKMPWKMYEIWLLGWHSDDLQRTIVNSLGTAVFLPNLIDLWQLVHWRVVCKKSPTHAGTSNSIKWLNIMSFAQSEWEHYVTLWERSRMRMIYLSRQYPISKRDTRYKFLFTPRVALLQNCLNGIVAVFIRNPWLKMSFCLPKLISYHDYPISPVL